VVGVWYNAPEDASAHQAAMNCVSHGRYKALAVAPLASGRLDPPDIALFYATPGAMNYFINGLQCSGHKRFDWSVVGESACADSWGRALKTREPSLSIPCFAEHRYGGVLDDEMLMALPPNDIGKAIAGMEALAKNGQRYPFPLYGIQTGCPRRHGGELPRPRRVTQPGHRLVSKTKDLRPPALCSERRRGSGCAPPLPETGLQPRKRERGVMTKHSATRVVLIACGRRG
jgi:hypothetical protein